MIASAIVLTPVAGSGLSVKTAGAASEDHAYKYFYERLYNDERAKKFYSAYEALGNSGAFKDGKLEYDLIANGYADVSDVAAYVNGTDNKLVKAFGAGRDAYIMDHPDLFYVDFFGTSVSAGQMGKEYAAYLDSSRTLTLYTGDFNSPAAVENAVATYEAKLSEIVSAVKAVGGVMSKIKSNLSIDTYRRIPNTASGPKSKTERMWIRRLLHISVPLTVRS